MSDHIRKKLPEVDPQYGGHLRYLIDMELGKHFHVANGDWHGEIIEVDGEKMIKVWETDDIRKIDYNSHVYIFKEEENDEEDDICI